MFPSSNRPFSPSTSSSVPHHVRRTSGSAGGSSFLAENLGFGRNLSANTSSSSSSSSTSSPPSSVIHPQSRSPQQRPPSSSSSASFKEQQQQLAMQQLSFKLEAQQLSNPSSTTSSLSSSSSSTPQSSHRSSFPISQIAHAQQSLNSLKRSSLPSSSSTSSLHHSPQPPYPHTPSSLSTPPSAPPPVSHLKIKRKIRKNTREKQRRSELNDKFDELQSLLQLGGGQTKVEKFAILSEAIGVIEQLKKDVAELRQEKVDTRAEVRKMTGVLEGFWPQNPEMAKEFAGRFFPRLSGVLSPPGSVGGGASVYGSGESMGGGMGGMGSYQSGGFQHLSGGQFHSGASGVSAAPSHSSHSSLMSPSSFLAFQQAAQQSLPPPIIPSYTNQLSGGVAKPPSHRRGNSRNGSTSSVNLQNLYSSASSIPGLGMGGIFPTVPPTPVVNPPPSSLPSLNGFSHHRKPSVPMPPPVRIPPLKSESDKPPFYGSNQSMSISPTAASSSFAFAQTPIHSSLSSLTGHRKQPSTDYKFSLSSLNSLQSPSPPTGGGAVFSSHSRSFSGQNSFNVNFNVNIPQADESTVPSFDSPAVGMFGSGVGVGGFNSGGVGIGSHGHHGSSGSLGGWVGGLGGGLGDGQGMDDVGAGAFN